MNLSGNQKDQFLSLNELDVFTIPGFSERMASIRNRISPKLAFLGSSIAEDIKLETGLELYPHVAKHARRTVNPPDETWVALSPSLKGYKMHVHLVLGLGYYGSFVKCVAKPNSMEKGILAKAINDISTIGTIWLLKGETPVEIDETSKDSVFEVNNYKSYGLEVGKVLAGVPGTTYKQWLEWATKEIESLWPLYEYVRKEGMY